MITELERRYLECNVCSELFDEDERIPRLLPCQHSFCSECLKRLGHRKDTIKCPSCNAVHKVKKNGPSDFPMDNTRRDLTSFLQTQSDLYAFKNVADVAIPWTLLINVSREQMINCNSMCSFLNAQQTVEDHIKQYLNAPVVDSTYNKNDSEEKMYFDDYPRSFNRNVDNLEITEDTASLLELAEEKHQKSLWTKTKNAVHILMALLLNTTPEFPNDEDAYGKLLNERCDADIMRMANKTIDGRVDNRRLLTLDEQIKRFAVSTKRYTMLSLKSKDDVHTKLALQLQQR
ncbi:TRIM71 [Mytilus coruscus]|uniref:TRIM71 n=1 Tax=Mytilus coruscus TaxID=42192 RepID=A0A6J8B975_MYTCO|nr:TRIM71 [Mytilus coruscus]